MLSSIPSEPNPNNAAFYANAVLWIWSDWHHFGGSGSVGIYFQPNVNLNYTSSQKNLNIISKILKLLKKF